MERVTGGGASPQRLIHRALQRAASLWDILLRQAKPAASLVVRHHQEVLDPGNSHGSVELE